MSILLSSFEDIDMSKTSNGDSDNDPILFNIPETFKKFLRLDVLEQINKANDEGTLHSKFLKEREKEESETAID